MCGNYLRAENVWGNTVCWFLGKNLSNFVPPVWKLHNLYCHTVYNVVPLTLVKDLLPTKQGLVRENSQPQCVPDIFTVKNEIKWNVKKVIN